MSLITVGAILVVAGGFYNRISGLTFPGGGGVTLDRPAVAQLIKTVASQASIKGDPHKISMAVDKALQRVASDAKAGNQQAKAGTKARFRPGSGVFPDDYLQLVAKDAADEVK